MSVTVSSASQTPIFKVGALVLCALGGQMQVLLVRPQPKHAGEVPPFVLPRGTRQYATPQGEWIDARDAETAITHADMLEPLTRTLVREIEEEAGVPPAMLRKATVHELGVRDFASRSKGTYPIHWFVVVLEAAQLPKLHAVPSDAMAVRWEALAEIEAMAAHGECSAGYVPVIREALAGWQGLPAVSVPKA